MQRIVLQSSFPGMEGWIRGFVVLNIMEEDKKFSLDEETLKLQRKKLSEIIENIKKTIAENSAISRNPHCDLNQRKWAEDRIKGNLEALNRYEKQLSETDERLNELRNEANQEYQRSIRAIEGGDS